MLHCYEFRGVGAYSHYHNYDTGMFTTIGNTISEKECIERYGDIITPLEKGLHYNLNTYGGNRNVYGVVIASTKIEAIQMLRRFDNSFTVVEYNPEQ